MELVFEKEEERSDELETSLELADSWKRQGDELLYSMIPRPIAERLRSGLNTLDTCQSFEQVSVIFGEVQVNALTFHLRICFFWLNLSRMNRYLFHFNYFVNKQDVTPSEDSIQDAMRAVATLNATFSAFDDEVKTNIVNRLTNIIMKLLY